MRANCSGTTSLRGLKPMACEGVRFFSSGAAAVLLKCSHTESMLRFCAARALPEAENQTPHYRHTVFRAGLLACLHPRLFSFPVSLWV